MKNYSKTFHDENKRNMIKGIIFDFDGLLVDTETIWYDIYRKWLKENYDYNLTIEEFVKCVGSTDEIMFEDIGRKISKKINVKKFEKDCVPIFIKNTKEMDLMEGVKKVILDFYNSGLKLALATSSKKERPLRILKDHDILKYFTCIITREDVKETKPNPEIFIKAAKCLKIDSTEVLIFEDSLNGLIAGNAANMKVIIVPNKITKHVNFENYYKKIDSFKNFNL